MTCYLCTATLEVAVFAVCLDPDHNHAHGVGNAWPGEFHFPICGGCAADGKAVGDFDVFMLGPIA